MTGVAGDVRRDYGDLSAAGQASLDRAAASHGVSVVQLMELAGWQVARWIFRRAGGLPIRVLVVAGHGNNGGDGLVAARHLGTWGFPVEVVIISELDRLEGVAADQAHAASALGLPLRPVPDGRVPAGLLDAAGVVVDAVLGTGVRGDPRPAHGEAISRLPADDRTVSVDVPSGLDATSGAAGNPTVRAFRTCTLGAVKSGLWTPTGRSHAGRLTVADIGLPAAAWREAGLTPPELVRGGALLDVPE